MAFRYEEKQNYGMKVGIIGASAAGLYTAILVAKRHPDYRVVVLEKNDKAGKKLLATGNGHCNLFNLSFSGNAFNHPEFVNTLLNKYSVSDLLATFRELGISTIEKDGLLYPLSFSAAAHVRYLVTLAESLGVQFRYGERVVGINGPQVTTDKNVYSFEACLCLRRQKPSQFRVGWIHVPSPFKKGISPRRTRAFFVPS